MKPENIPQQIQDKAKEHLAKGSKMTFEALCNMLIKIEEKAAKKINSKKEEAKWAQRELSRNTEIKGDPSVWLAEKNRENAMNNLPSSMRKY